MNTKDGENDRDLSAQGNTGHVSTSTSTEGVGLAKNNESAVLTHTPNTATATKDTRLVSSSFIDDAWNPSKESAGDDSNQPLAAYFDKLYDAKVYEYVHVVSDVAPNSTNVNHTAKSKCIFDGLSEDQVVNLAVRNGHTACNCSDDPNYQPAFNPAHNGKGFGVMFWNTVFCVKANHQIAKLPLIRWEEETELHAELTSKRDAGQALQDKIDAKRRPLGTPWTIQDTKDMLAECHIWQSKLYEEECVAWDSFKKKWDDRYDKEIDSLLVKYGESRSSWWKRTLENPNSFLTPTYYFPSVDVEYVKKWEAAIEKRRLLIIEK